MAGLDRLTVNRKRRCCDAVKDISGTGGKTTMKMIILAGSGAEESVLR